jgi:hypothetical protein
VVAEVANCTVSIMRGVGYDEYGDISDDMAAVTPGIPAVLIETSRSVFDPATQTPRTVRSATLRVPAWTKVLSSDQIRDDSTGNTYSIEDITLPPTTVNTSVGGASDLVLTLRRVTSSGV